MVAGIMEVKSVLLSKSASEGGRFSALLSSDSTISFEWSMKQGI